MICHAKNAVNAAKSTVSSNMIGKNAGTAKKHPSGGTQHHERASLLRKELQRSDTPPPLRTLCDRTGSSSSCALLSRRPYGIGRQIVVGVRLRYGGLHFGHCNHR